MSNMKQYNDKSYKMAIHNTKYNSDGKAIIERNDEWREEKEWDMVYEELEKEQKRSKY